MIDKVLNLYLYYCSTVQCDPDLTFTNKFLLLNVVTSKAGSKLEIIVKAGLKQDMITSVYMNFIDSISVSVFVFCTGHMIR